MRNPYMAVRLSTLPDSISVEIHRAACIVVDMQNGFLSPGGMYDQAGVDISYAQRTIFAAQRALTVIRASGIPVVYLQTGQTVDLSTAGGEDSPCPEKSMALRMLRADPQLKGKLMTFGAWNAEIVDAVKPQPNDIVVRKSRY